VFNQHFPKQKYILESKHLDDQDVMMRDKYKFLFVFIC